MEDAFDLALTASLDDDQHPLLRFREHHVVRSHPTFAPRHPPDVDSRAGTIDPTRAFGDRRGQAGSAQVLDRDHGVGVREVHACFEQAFLEERVADLDGGTSLGAVLVELD